MAGVGSRTGRADPRYRESAERQAITSVGDLPRASPTHVPSAGR